MKTVFLLVLLAVLCHVAFSDHHGGGGKGADRGGDRGGDRGPMPEGERGDGPGDKDGRGHRGPPRHRAQGMERKTQMEGRGLRAERDGSFQVE